MVSRLAESVRTSSKQSLERRAARLAGARADLTPEEDALLSLRIDKNLSWDQIAHALSDGDRPLDPATLRKRYERLKEKLARKVGRSGQ